MTASTPPPSLGHKVTHPEFGEGVVVGEAVDEFIRVWFPVGERQVPITSVRGTVSRAERLLVGVAADIGRARRAWLAVEAHAMAGDDWAMREGGTAGMLAAEIAAGIPAALGAMRTLARP